MAAQSKAGRHGCLSVVYCEVEVFVMGKLLIQKSPTECYEYKAGIT